MGLKGLQPTPGTLKFEIIVAVIQHKHDKFTIPDIITKLPHIKKNTIQTFISRDFRKLGLVKKIEQQIAERPYIYTKLPLLKQMESKYIKADNQWNEKRLKEHHDHVNLKQISYDKYEHIRSNKPPKHGSYASIGKGIETLLNEKNAYIAALEEDNQESNDMIKALEETIQSHERHIREQSLKIHALNEKLRNQSGGAIKLDELQDILNKTKK